MRKEMKWWSKADLCNSAQWENCQVESTEDGEDAGDKVMSEGVKVGTQKKIRDYLGIFPNMGGGGFPIPKTQNLKKMP